MNRGHNDKNKADKLISQLFAGIFCSTAEQPGRIKACIVNPSFILSFRDYHYICTINPYGIAAVFTFNRITDDFLAVIFKCTFIIQLLDYESEPVETQVIIDDDVVRTSLIKKR
jgi:hypothetical protein